MNPQAKCSDCDTELEIGFIPDASYLTVLQSQWHAGTPEDSRFLGLKPHTIFGKDVPSIKHDSNSMMPVTAYRCPDCGVLKFYAHPKRVS